MFRRKDNDAPLPEAPRTMSEAKPAIVPVIPKREDAPPASAQGASLAAPSSPARPVVAEDMSGKRLIVGQGIKLSGEITACDRLVVEGFVEATLNETRALEIARTGRFIGGCEVEEAEVSGNYEGELTVRSRLLIRSSGTVKGNIRYGEIEIERGGTLAGSVAMLERKQD